MLLGSFYLKVVVGFCTILHCRVARSYLAAWGRAPCCSLESLHTYKMHMCSMMTSPSSDIIVTLTLGGGGAIQWHLVKTLWDFQSQYTLNLFVDNLVHFLLVFHTSQQLLFYGWMVAAS